MGRTKKSGGEITIIDVAREAGVSYATVSRVINRTAAVTPDKYERVIQAMTRLGYVANQQARSLAGGRSQIIGLLVPTVGEEYIGEIVLGIEAEVVASQYELLLYTTHHHKLRESSYVASLTRGLADGLLLLLPRNPQAYLQALAQRAFPHVLIDNQVTDQPYTSAVPTVNATNYAGALSAMHYLLDLGHRRISFITGDRDLLSARERLSAYKAALQERGLAIDAKLICEANFDLERSYEYTLELLALPEPPTAIFAANDLMAFTVQYALTTRGLRIPEDCSVIGFDDIPQAAQARPPLTTVRQPLREMGRTAARLLIEHIKHPEKPLQSVELPTELIMRASCAPPRSSSHA